MKIKAFAFDMDGTLLLSDGSSVHLETLKALNEAHEAGYKIILATGRSVGMTTPTAEAIGTVSYLVSDNGASIYDVANKENISKTFLTFEAFEEVVKVAKETKSFFSVSTTKGDYRIIFFDEKDVPKWVETSFDETTIKLDKMERIYEAVKNEDVTQFTTKNSQEVVKAQKEILEKSLGKVVSMYIANKVYLDITPKNLSKLSGIKEVIGRMGIDISEVMAFGDSGNDLQMIEGVGYGVAMDNATKEAKAVSKEVIGHHDTDAIAKKIREVIASQSK